MDLRSLQTENSEAAEEPRRSPVIEQAQRNLPQGETYLSPSPLASAPLPLARPTSASAEPPRQSAITILPIPEGTTIDKVGESEFRLSGRDVERAVALSDVTTPDALNYIDERLKNLGIPRLLARAGATDGCVVHIGTFSFDYVPET